MNSRSWTDQAVFVLIHRLYVNRKLDPALAIEYTIQELIEVCGLVVTEDELMTKLMNLQEEEWAQSLSDGNRELDRREWYPSHVEEWIKNQYPDEGYRSVLMRERKWEEWIVRLILDEDQRYNLMRDQDWPEWNQEEEYAAIIYFSSKLLSPSEIGTLAFHRFGRQRSIDFIETRLEWLIGQQDLCDGEDLGILQMLNSDRVASYLAELIPDEQRRAHVLRPMAVSERYISNEDPWAKFPRNPGSLD